MSGPVPLKSPHRWTLLKILAEADTPLTRKQMAERTGLTHWSVSELLKRPRTAGWVSATRPPESKGFGSGVPLLYTITDIGREALAAHTKENTP